MHEVKSESEVAQSCPTPSDPMDCSLPGSSVRGIFPGKSTGVGCHCLLQLIISKHISKIFQIKGTENICVGFSGKDNFKYIFLFCPPKFIFLRLLQFSSVAQSCWTLCNPINRSTPGLPVHHQLPEFTQTHVHLVGDAIQPSHPLSSPFPPAPNPSQQQSLFQ